MPRDGKRPRLWLRPAGRRRDGFIRRAGWVILDRGKHIATGCSESETERADQALADYIAAKYRPARRERDLSVIDIADVLAIYFDHKGGSGAPPKFRNRIGRLNDFFGGRKLAELDAALCRDYVEARGSRGGARRDLEDLRAAVNHHAGQGFHRGIVKVPLPEKGEPRDRWLTRSEAARLLWTCWRAREFQRRHRGADAGETLPTRKYPLRHLARFILIGLYTGTRASPIAAASPIRKEGRSWVDLERGVFYRRQIGRKKENNKRQFPAPIPPRLLAHMRRWHRVNPELEHFVEHNGRPVKSVKTAFASAVARAGIAAASPHCLRHTAATWLMQNGAPTWQAAGFLAMSEKTLLEVYGHHHPDYMDGAVAAIERRPQPRQSLVVSLVAESEKRRKA